MKRFRIEDYVNLANPTPGEMHRPEILLAEHNAKALGGMLGLLPARCQVPYHFHKNRESIIIFISGEGIEIVEGEEFSVRAGDILFIPAGEKHTTLNRSDSDLRYLEFFTCPPVTADFVEVKENAT
jgi:quercetin dioxygenase-like cupin family protein